MDQLDQTIKDLDRMTDELFQLRRTLDKVGLDLQLLEKAIMGEGVSE